MSELEKIVLEKAREREPSCEERDLTKPTQYSSPACDYCSECKVQKGSHYIRCYVIDTVNTCRKRLGNKK